MCKPQSLDWSRRFLLMRLFISDYIQQRKKQGFFSRLWFWLGFAALVATGMFACHRVISDRNNLMFLWTRIRAIRQHGRTFGLMISTAMTTLQPLGAPMTPFEVAAGFCFGWAKGLIIGTFGKLCGSFLTFYIVQLFRNAAAVLIGRLITVVLAPLRAGDHGNTLPLSTPSGVGCSASTNGNISRESAPGSNLGCNLEVGTLRRYGSSSIPARSLGAPHQSTAPSEGPNELNVLEEAADGDEHGVSFGSRDLPRPVGRNSLQNALATAPLIGTEGSLPSSTMVFDTIQFSGCTDVVADSVPAAVSASQATKAQLVTLVPDIAQGIDRSPYKYSMMLRLIMVPLAMKNYILALLGVKFLPYTVSLLLTTLPFSILNAKIGSSTFTLFAAIAEDDGAVTLNEVMRHKKKVGPTNADRAAIILELVAMIASLVLVVYAIKSVQARLSPALRNTMTSAQSISPMLNI